MARITRRPLAAADILDIWGHIALNPVGAALCGVMIERVGAGQTLAFFACVFGLLAVAALSSRTIRNEPTLAGA